MAGGRNTVQRFDAAALYVALDRRRRAAGLTWTEVGRSCSLGDSLFTRLKLGGSLSVDSLLNLMRWMGETDVAPYQRPEFDTEAGGRSHVLE